MQIVKCLSKMQVLDSVRRTLGEKIQARKLGCRGPGAKLQNEAPCVCGRSEQKGRKQGNLGELNLEALLGPCRLLLLRVSFNKSKEFITKNFDISICGPLNPETLGKTAVSAPPSRSPRR